MTDAELNALVDERIAVFEAAANPQASQPAAGAAKGFSQADLDTVAQDAATAAIKSTAAKYEQLLVEARRPSMAGAPVMLRGKQDPQPMWWAIKSVLANPNGSVILSDTPDGLAFRAEGNPSAIKSFQAYAEASRWEVGDGIVYGVKAGMETTASSAIGEHFVPRIQRDGVIDALYAQSFVRNLPGVDIYPMPGLICDAPSIATFSAGWTAENATAQAAGDATTGRKTLTAKNLTAIATLSNQLLTDSNPGIERYIRQGLAGAMGQAHDDGALNGTGAPKPVGLLAESGPASTALGSDNLYVAIAKALGRMATNLIPMQNVAVIMHPLAAVKALTTQLGSNGDYIGRMGRTGASFMPGGNLGALLAEALGVPVFLTPLLPVATGTASSTVLVLHSPSWTIGDRQELEIASSNVAGNAFAYNQTMVRAIMRVDFNLKRATALEKITTVLH